MQLTENGGVMIEVLITLAICNFAITSTINHLVAAVAVAAQQARWCEVLINV